MDITIEKLIYGGEGLAHHDGSTVFVPFVLPAERVSAAPIETKKKFVRARMERVLDPSPQRAAARCPHFGICGGCDYQHIPYDAQLTYKAEILRETLRRLGRVDWTGEISAHGSQPWGYRNRAQWKIRSPEKSGELLASGGAQPPGIGYFRAQSTTLCAVHDCPIVSPLLLKTLLAFREALGAGKLPGELREIEAFADASDSKLLLTATFAGFPRRKEEAAATFRRLVPEIESLLFHDPGRERMELDGPGFIEYEAADAKYRVGHLSFFQVNRFLIDELARTVISFVARGRLALDLFAGVGLFSVPLSASFERVVAVESNPAAARDLESNVAYAGRGIEVRTADVETFLTKYRGRENPDLVILDPPRAGLAPGAAKALARIAPGRIVYVSCEPPTLARDLAVLVQAGYEISELHLFDLFPQTFHMETVVRLQKRA